MKRGTERTPESEAAVEIALEDLAERLLEALAHVRSGEEVIIAEHGQPFTRLVPAAPARRLRVPGVDRGRVRIADDFDAPLPEEVLRRFEG